MQLEEGSDSFEGGKILFVTKWSWFLTAQANRKMFREKSFFQNVIVTPIAAH